MDDSQLRASLRDLEVPTSPRPEFVNALHDDLASRLGLVQGTPAIAPSQLRRRPASRVWLLAAAVALLLAAAIGMVVTGAIVERMLDRQSLLKTIESEQSVRIAVSSDYPQVLVPGRSIQGFDVDVADALATQLGVRAELLIGPADAMLTSRESAWQVGLPGRSVADLDGRYLTTAPYYRWPIYLLVPATDPVDNLDALDGAPVCVVAGSPGEAWLDQQAPGLGLEVLSAAPQALVQAVADEAACFAELGEGGSRAMVTDSLLPADIATRGDVTMVQAAPVAVEPRPAVVPLAQPGASQLIEKLNSVIAELRAQGTLGTLSRQRFGGQDLS
jgi:ABC-type amino acid transport substrate-binding protein